MRGEIFFKLLKTIVEVGGDTKDIIEAMLIAGYGASFRRVGEVRYRLSLERQERKDKEEREMKVQQRIHSFLYHLKKEGFVRESEEENHKKLELTTAGRRKLDLLRSELDKKLKSALPEVTLYEKKRGDRYIIIVFDIPEKERRKRAWLRSVLKNLGFAMLQKSVWLGKAKLPENFILDLKRLNLFEFIEILSITKSGTLRQVIR